MPMDGVEREIAIGIMRFSSLSDIARPRARDFFLCHRLARLYFVHRFSWMIRFLGKGYVVFGDEGFLEMGIGSGAWEEMIFRVSLWGFIVVLFLDFVGLGFDYCLDALRNF